MCPVRTRPVTFSYTYDTLGRPASLTDASGYSLGYNTGSWSGAPVNWVQNVTYDVGSRMTSMQLVDGYLSSSNWSASYAQQTMTYNASGQMTSINWSSNYNYSYLWTTAVGVQYNYSATQNNGQITQAVDTLSGETITYQYDQLKRLTSASSTPNSGSSPAAYTQTHQYDGFGNLTAKVLNGTSTPIAVNATTNRLTNSNYDANGNMLSGVGATFTYDEGNRVESETEVSGGTEYYGYGPDNKRMYRLTSTGQELITFYGAYGEKLGMYGVTANPLYTNIWFAGRLIIDSNFGVYRDRLGTNRVNGWGVYGGMSSFDRFYPYGDEITSTGNDRTKFGTYNRDSFTGVDYADQRYYASLYGRFLTTDPAELKAVKPKNPTSWNRYSYTRGDPVTRYDPRGLDDCDPGDCVCDSDGQNCFDCDPSSPACWFCANPIDPDAPGPCLPPDNGGGGSSGGGGGGGGGNSFAGDPVRDGVDGILMTNLKCDQLLFGPNATAASAMAQFSPIQILPSSQLPSGAPPLGTATVQGTQANWGSNEPWAEMNGLAIYVNDKYFPGDVLANISTPWGQTLSAVQVFNHDHKTSLTPLQVEETVILHELSHIKGGSGVDSTEALAKLISICIN